MMNFKKRVRSLNQYKNTKVPGVVGRINALNDLATKLYQTRDLDNLKSVVLIHYDINAKALINWKISTPKIRDARHVFIILGHHLNFNHLDIAMYLGYSSVRGMKHHIKYALDRFLELSDTIDTIKEKYELL